MRIAGDAKVQNYRIHFAYDGTAYHGFQIQKNALTVQQVLEEALQQLFEQNIRLEGAGRTDAGVHAREQVASFYASPRIPVERLPYALNGLLPPDIVVYEAASAEPGFSARKDARAKLYTYTIDNGLFPDVFFRLYAWHLRKPLKVEAMDAAAAHLQGQHDFKAFQSSNSDTGGTVRTLFQLSVSRLPGSRVVLSYEGDGFLYKMVRNITGTLVEVGLGKREPPAVKKILESKDRRWAGVAAPPHGLCLERVYYR